MIDTSLSKFEVFTLLLVIFVWALVPVSEYFSLGYTPPLEVMATVGLSGLLVVLYSQQKRVLDDQSGFLDRQTDLMREQTKMFQQEYNPNIRFNRYDSEYQDDTVIIDVENKGAGLALDIGFEITIEEGGRTFDAFCPSVRLNGEPKTAGAIEAFTEQRTAIEIRLPSIEASEEGEITTKPYSEALADFDYDDDTEYDILIRESCANATGEQMGGQVLFDGQFRPDEARSPEELGFF